MDDTTHRALARSGVIDLTTTGRRTGAPRRIEIYLHSLDGRLFISGIPVAGRTRAWLRNAAADPRITIHLKGPIGIADLDATARVVDDGSERRAIMPAIAANWGRTDLEAMIEHSPLMEVTLPGFPG